MEYEYIFKTYTNKGKTYILPIRVEVKIESKKSMKKVIESKE